MKLRITMSVPLHQHAYHYMHVYCVENVSAASTYIALNALEILMHSVNSIDIYSIYFLQIENWLNHKKVMGRNVCMCFVLNASTYIALNVLEILIPYVNSVNIYSI